MLCAVACQTTKQETQTSDVIPAIAFPVFPDPEPVQYNECVIVITCQNTKEAEQIVSQFTNIKYQFLVDAVFMPLWYWQDIARFKIDVDTVNEYLQTLRNKQTKTETETEKKK